MNISVVGTGYVGLVTGACLADLGHSVMCADVDADKIAALRKSRIPLYEPGLDELVGRAVAAGTLGFTTDVSGAVRESSMVFIAVGTPASENGSADTRALFQVADTIGQAMESHKTVVLKSTVPIGSAQNVRTAIALKTDSTFSVLSNPEFLREGHSVEDFMGPSRVVIGTDEDRTAAEPLYQLYSAFVPSDRIVVLDTRTAEMSKYVSNAFLATKISFINEMANLCDDIGADIEQVRQVLGLDPRIGLQYLSPGIGYGGSCFPKDVQAIMHTADAAGTPLSLLKSVHQINETQPDRLVRKVFDYFGNDVAGRRIAVWGLAFKPGTDDVRGSRSLALIHALVRAGANIVAYDPTANARAKESLDGLVQYATDPYECVRGSDALIVATEWDEFRSPDWGVIRRDMRTPAVFDGRNLYDPRSIANEGFAYFGVGRGKELAATPSEAPTGTEPEVRTPMGNGAFALTR